MDTLARVVAQDPATPPASVLPPISNEFHVRLFIIPPELVFRFSVVPTGVYVKRVFGAEGRSLCGIAPTAGRDATQGHRGRGLPLDLRREVLPEGL